MKCNHLVGYLYDEYDVTFLYKEPDDIEEEVFYNGEVKFNYCPDCGEKLS